MDFTWANMLVTQGQYLAVVGTNPSYFTTTDWNGKPISPDLNRPVETVSWNDATNYCVPAHAIGSRGGADTV